ASPARRRRSAARGRRGAARETARVEVSEIVDGRADTWTWRNRFTYSSSRSPIGTCCALSSGGEVGSSTYGDHWSRRRRAERNRERRLLAEPHRWQIRGRLHPRLRRV